MEWRWCSTLAALSWLASASPCAAAMPRPGHAFSYALVTFRLDIPSAANAVLRRRLLELASTEQVRGGPIGIDGDVFGSPAYVVRIGGTCRGASSQVRNLVARSASGAADQRVIVRSYDVSVGCETKHRDASWAEGA